MVGVMVCNMIEIIAFIDWSVHGWILYSLYLYLSHFKLLLLWLITSNISFSLGTRHAFFCTSNVLQVLLPVLVTVLQADYCSTCTTSTCSNRVTVHVFWRLTVRSEELLVSYQSVNSWQTVEKPKRHSEPQQKTIPVLVLRYKYLFLFHRYEGSYFIYRYKYYKQQYNNWTARAGNMEKPLSRL